MDERTFEIVLSRYPEGLLPDGWVLEGQQIGLSCGVLDLLLRDRNGVRHLVELKKGPATVLAVDQVLHYANALDKASGGQCVPWVVAHSVPAAVARDASDRGVRTLAIPQATCEAVLQQRGVDVSDLIVLRRRASEALTGGAGDVWSAVDNDVAFSEMPAGMATFMSSLASQPEFALNSGRSQTIIRYRGVKLGGVNRKNQPHGYLTSGVLASESERTAVAALGFRWMEKHQAGSSHVHTWFQIPISEHVSYARGLEVARAAVERTLGGDHSIQPQLEIRPYATAPGVETKQRSARASPHLRTSTAKAAGPAVVARHEDALDVSDRKANQESAADTCIALAAVREGRCRCRIKSGRHYVLWVTLEHLARSNVADWGTVLAEAEQRLRRDHGQRFDPNYMDIDWFRGWLDDGAPKEGSYWEGTNAPPVCTRVERRPERLVLAGAKNVPAAIAFAKPPTTLRTETSAACKHGLLTATCGYCSRQGMR
jgi:hypothetical protein